MEEHAQHALYTVYGRPRSKEPETIIYTGRDKCQGSPSGFSVRPASWGGGECARARVRRASVLVEPVVDMVEREQQAVG